MPDMSLERLLEQCLQDVSSSEDVQAILQRYPQEADHLRPLLETALAAKTYYADVPEPPGRLAAGRSRLLDVAADQRRSMSVDVTPNQTEGRTYRMRLATRLIAVLAAVAISIGAFGATAAMASESLPGDMLYPAKLAVEDVRLGFASTPQARLNLALRFADERLAEMEALAESDLAVPGHILTRFQDHLTLALRQAAQAQEGEISGFLQQIAQHTQTQLQTMEQLGEGAQEQTRAQVQSARQICQQTQQEAMGGVDDPQLFRWRYQSREQMPEDVTPPEPADNGPGGGEGNPHGPSDPGQGPPDEPPGGGQGGPEGEPEQHQNQAQEQNQECDPEQGPECVQEQNQEGELYQYQYQGQGQGQPTSQPNRP